jgi:GNAT superfamily N-acetyltransferase
MDLDDAIAANPELFTGLYRIGEPRRSSPSIAYQVETLSQVRNDILPLIERHYQEIAQFKDAQKLDPDWDDYAALERNGKLWVLTARDRGVLIGYFVMVVSRSRHYRTLLMASEDIHYLLPEYRRGLTGYRLIAKTVAAMKERGVGLTLLRTKAGQSHAVLFERLDGELSDLVYVFKR